MQTNSLQRHARKQVGVRLLIPQPNKKGEMKYSFYGPLFYTKIAAVAWLEKQSPRCVADNKYRVQTVRVSTKEY